MKITKFEVREIFKKIVNWHKRTGENKMALLLRGFLEQVQENMPEVKKKPEKLRKQTYT